MMRSNEPAFFRRVVFAGLMTLWIPAVSLADLSVADADAIVRAEMSAKADRDAEQRAQLLEVPASREWVVEQGGQRTVMRRVASPPSPSLEAASIAGPTDEEEQQVPHSGLLHLNFTLFVTVFDREVTEIVWRDRENEYTVLTNSSLGYLPVVETIATEDGTFSFFSFVQHVNTETETARARPDPAVFSSSAPEYIVHAEDDAPHSETFMEAIDTLHRHYLENRADYEARAQRAAALQAAWERAKPPEPRETVINFWRREEGTTPD